MSDEFFVEDFKFLKFKAVTGFKIPINESTTFLLALLCESGIKID